MARILVVDDERDVVLLIRFLLEKDGHQVIEAFNGAQALEKLGIDPADDSVELPDLILLDLLMPIVDGQTVCKKAGKHPRAKNIPLVILTARGQLRDLQETAPNVTSQLEKPFDPQKLRETVRSVLGEAKP